MPDDRPRLPRHHYLLALALFLVGVTGEFLFLGGVGWMLDRFYQLGPSPIEVPIMQWLEARERTRFNNVMLQITALGSVTVLTLATALAIIGLCLAKRRRIALSVFVAAVGAATILTTVKRVVDRTRPFKADVVARGLDQFVEDTHSFPSGHAMGSMAIYGMLAWLFAPLAPNRACARFIVVAGIGLSLVIGLSRMYLGVHYPSDVMSGWIGGAFWLFITLWAFRLLDPAQEWLAQGFDKSGA